MSGDKTVGEWENGVFNIVDKALAPMYLVNTGNVNRWLETRAIDYHRANSRLLKKALRLAEKDDVSTVISVNAATITDNYWIKPIDSTLTYNDVRFDNDYFAGLAVFVAKHFGFSHDGTETENVRYFIARRKKEIR